MKKNILIGTLIFGLSVIAGAAFAQGEYFVQSVKAKVMTTPSFKGSVLAEVAKGHKFASLGKEGSWIKVKHDSKEGYVSALLLGTREPMGRVGLIKGEDSEIKQGVRRRASTYTSAAAARGLTHEDRQRASVVEEVDYKALETIEAIAFSQEDISRFAEGGKL